MTDTNSIDSLIRVSRRATSHTASGFLPKRSGCFRDSTRNEEPLRKGSSSDHHQNGAVVCKPWAVLFIATCRMAFLLLCAHSTHDTSPNGLCFRFGLFPHGWGSVFCPLCSGFSTLFERPMTQFRLAQATQGCHDCDPCPETWAQ